MFKNSLRAMLYVRSVGASTDFYRRQLGFALEGAYGPDYAVVRASGQGVGLHSDAGVAMQKGGVILYAEVDDVDAYHDRVVAAGVDASALKNEEWGERVFYVEDPDGHAWGFYTPLGAAPRQVKTVKAKAKAKAPVGNVKPKKATKPKATKPKATKPKATKPKATKAKATKAKATKTKARR